MGRLSEYMGVNKHPDSNQDRTCGYGRELGRGFE